MSDNPLQQMRGRGQSVWLRGFRRRLVESGRFSELVASAAVSGLETDPEVIAAAVTRGQEYLEPLRRLAGEGEVRADRLLAQEARIAAAALLPAYEESGGRDGVVGVPLEPALRNDPESLAHAAHRMLAEAGTPNVVPMLPPTSSGFAVFEALVADGRAVYVGPVFSVASVVRACEAYLRGTQGCGATAPPMALVSFGVGPLDVALDELLRDRIRAAGREMSAVESLVGGSATAIARIAWRRQREFLAARIADPAARLLRMAWTGLSSTDPRQRRERYVDSLVGPDTVVVLDRGLLRGVMDRNRARVDATLGQRVDEAEEIVAEIAALGIDTEAVGETLEVQALRQAQAAYGDLARRIDDATRIATGDSEHATELAATGSPWSASRPEIDDALATCDEAESRRAVTRMWEKDVSLWSDDEETADLVRSRLGWLDVAAASTVEWEPLRRFTAELVSAEVENVVLLGMGGSSLATEVCRRAFGSNAIQVLDSTLPSQIKAIADTVDPARTLIMVASKSGTTVEVRALLDCFYALATPMLDKPGERFVAITDPGTPLEQIAHERGFARLWLAPSDIGGRFSALTVFGTLPMAVMGIDVPSVLASARRMAANCGPEVDARVNPAARLGAALHQAHDDGRDKITFVISDSLSAFGLWAEQLIAESTGKQGCGLIPVVDEPAASVDRYGDDRLFVSMSLAAEQDRSHRERIDAIDAAGHPMLHIELDDPHDLGAEFFRWEAGVAIAGALMGINPFDQPDVQASKDRTSALLGAHKDGTPMSDRPPLATDAGWAVFADIERDEDLASRVSGGDLESWLAAHLGRAEVPDYVGIQAFVAAAPETRSALQGLRELLLERRGVASTLGWGPGFLHSTGQLHKGGPDCGLFLQITADEPEDIDVPGAGYSFRHLARAQSLGDLAALQERGRRVLRVHLRDAVEGSLALLEAATVALS
jgi:transaldolase/glucose-6-phosphate isomerase